jgi:ABC-type phosphate transport system permease subunit
VALVLVLFAGCNWIRIPTIMYGVHAATTVVPMLADFYYGQGRHNPQKELLCAIYGTYLVFPLLIALTMAFSRIPFPAEKKKKVA